MLEIHENDTEEASLLRSHLSNTEPFKNQSVCDGIPQCSQSRVVSLSRFNGLGTNSYAYNKIYKS